ncbi:MAG: AAA family ATPase, partial [Planctomycetota bacterium]
KAAAALVALGARPRIVRWEGAPVGGDAADWVAAVTDPAEAFEALLAAAVPWRPAGTPAVAVRALSDVHPRDVEWVWRGFLPRGEWTSWQGDGGVGKSTLLGYVAAQVTAGGLLPHPHEAGSMVPVGAGRFLLLCVEEPDYIIERRARAFGADLGRYLLLEGERCDVDGEEILLPLHLQQFGLIEQAFERFRPDVFCVDPVQGHLPPESSMNSAEEMRPVFARVGALLRKYGTSGVMVRHEGKDRTRPDADRALGSTDLTALSRVAFKVAKEADEAADPPRRAVFCLKSNLGPRPRPLPFALEEDGGEFRLHATDTDLRLSDCTYSPPRRKSRPTAGDVGADFLRDALADGPVRVKELKALAKEAGISDRGLESGRAILGVEYGRNGAAGYIWLPGHAPDWYVAKGRK